MRVVRQFDESHTFAEIGSISFLMTHDLLIDPVLLQLPLLRHLNIKRIIDAAIEFIDIHHAQPVLKPIMLGAKSCDGGVMFALFVGMAFAQAFREPGQNIGAEGQAVQNGGEFLAENFLTHVGLAAIPLESGAMIVNVATLFDLADNSAAAMAAVHEAGKGKVVLLQSDFAGAAIVQHILDAFP